MNSSAMKSPWAGPLSAMALALVASCSGISNGKTKPRQDAPESSQRARPNIVFIYSDDHATAAIGTYQNSVVASYAETPNIDSLASAGMRFDSAFCTNGICAPARAVVLTGKHSNVNGVTDNGSIFDGSQVTFPKLLRDGGYQTALIGKWHLKTNPTGFDYWAVLPGQGQYYAPEFIRPAANYDEEASVERQAAESMTETQRIEGYATEVTTDLGLAWLEEQRDPEKPFLLMLQHKAPHRNWMPSPDQHTLYADEDLPEPVTLFDDYQGRASGAQTQEMSITDHMWLWYDLKVPTVYWGLEDPDSVELDGPDRWAAGIEARMNDEQRKAWLAAYTPGNEAFRDARQAGELEGDALTSWKYQRYIKDYLRCINGVDDSVGRVTEWLEANGLDENTIVVYSSDQGFFLGEHGWYDKRWMYEQSLQLPLVVRWPGTVAPGGTDAHLVQNLDFAPTFLEVAGIEIPDAMQGQSLVPLLRGEELSKGEWRDSIYYRYFEVGIHAVPPHYGVRTERYKLIYYHDLKEWEMFDLERDPDELESCFDAPEYAVVQGELELELQRLREVYGDVE